MDWKIEGCRKGILLVSSVEKHEFIYVKNISQSVYLVIIN